MSIMRVVGFKSGQIQKCFVCWKSKCGKEIVENLTAGQRDGSVRLGIRADSLTMCLLKLVG